jgi:WD40 repeat protein
MPGGFELIHFNISLEFQVYFYRSDSILLFPQPVQRILAAHVKESSCNAGSSRQRKVEPNHHSVTSVAFLDDTVLASAGANDGTVKLWDLRKTFYNVPNSIFTIRNFSSFVIIGFLSENLH